MTDGRRPAAPLPVTLMDEKERIGRARSMTRHVLARGRARRRVIPPLVAGSAALLGSSVVGSWLFDLVPPPATASAARPTPPAAATLDGTRLAQSVTALDNLRQALAADQAAIAALAQTSAAAGSAASAAGGAPTSGGSAPTTNGAGGSSAPVASAAPTGTASSPSLPTLPSVPSLPALPTITVPAPAPPVHTTTGATVVVH